MRNSVGCATMTLFLASAVVNRPCARRTICALTPSAKLPRLHPVNPLGDHDLSMLAIADVSAEDTGAALPAHRVAGTPSRRYHGRPRSRTYLGTLARLPRHASG
jgi:hypothetical protein